MTISRFLGILLGIMFGSMAILSLLYPNIMASDMTANEVSIYENYLVSILILIFTFPLLVPRRLVKRKPTLQKISLTILIVGIFIVGYRYITGAFHLQDNQSTTAFHISFLFILTIMILQFFELKNVKKEDK